MLRFAWHTKAGVLADLWADQDLILTDAFLLCRITFMFPNQFAVYLHDTPNRPRFKQVQCDFSSGCIRVEEPATTVRL